MGNDINRKRPTRTLYVTKGADETFTLRRYDPSGEPTDWDAEVFADIDVEPAVRVEADVDGSLAVVHLESTLCDQVENGTKWRVLMSQAGTPTLETAVLVGVFKRND